MFIAQPNIQNLPTTFSGCPSEARSLAFDRRCQFSDRDCKPADSLLGAYEYTYNRVAFISVHRFMVAVCGRSSGLPRLPNDSVLQTRIQLPPIICK
ncbi:hypothetical protein EMIT0P253_140053 [Pseudomonas sp. IT-P253]